MTIDTHQLRELLAKATPAPWEATPREEYLANRAKYGGARFITKGSKGAYLFATQGTHGDPSFFEDGELIVALRNAAPALLDELDRLRAEHMAYKDALEAIANHDHRTRAVSKIAHTALANVSMGRIPHAALSKDAT